MSVLMVLSCVLGTTVLTAFTTALTMERLRPSYRGRHRCTG
ncbi:MAG TPA: hypothetical protein VIL71_22400 [Spirillospora sp.]|mgnify:CR=1 FL=1